jgi:hypothetical protein
MKIRDIVAQILLAALFISIALNAVQYVYFRKEPVIETVIQRDTVTSVDTVIQKLRFDTVIYRPRPVRIDTVERITTYRDTIFHDYGWIERTELTTGELLSKGIDYEFIIPEYYKQRTITNTITRTVRNDLLFVHGGFSYSFSDFRAQPVLGISYIWNNHARKVSLSYSLDKRIEFTAGVALRK